MGDVQCWCAICPFWPFWHYELPNPCQSYSQMPNGSNRPGGRVHIRFPKLSAGHPLCQNDHSPTGLNPVEIGQVAVDVVEHLAVGRRPGQQEARAACEYIHGARVCFSEKYSTADTYLLQPTLDLCHGPSLLVRFHGKPWMQTAFGKVVTQHCFAVSQSIAAVGLEGDQ